MIITYKTSQKSNLEQQVDEKAKNQQLRYIRIEEQHKLQ